MFELKLICLADLPERSEEEIAASIAKDKAAYQKKLEAITGSAVLKRRAKRITARDMACGKCVYLGPEVWMCCAPYSDAYMEDLDINPCYEGVLKYLAENSRR